MITEQSRFLVIDFGTQYLGIATAQMLTQSAAPLAPLKAKDGVPNWQELEELLAKWQPDVLLIGMPLNMDGSINEITLRANKFRNRLAEKFQLPVFGVDERLSSFAAKEHLLGQGRQAKNFKADNVDGEAAVCIFQTWLHCYLHDGSLDQIPSAQIKQLAKSQN